MKKGIALLVILFVAISFQANAELIVRGTDSLGNQLIYDTDLNITWYDYTNPYRGEWDYQQSWVSGLSVNLGGTVYDDWRLPITFDCLEFNCTNSEMGHLYYIELGNSPYCDTNGNCPQPGWTAPSFGPFKQISTYKPYWSMSSYGPYGSYVAPSFDFGSGHQWTYYPWAMFHGIAVRPGDVAVVPEPISSTLFVIGAGVLAGRRFFRERQ